MRTRLFQLAVIAALSSKAFATETITLEPDGSSYHFVSHYSVDVDAPASVVWKHLIDIGSWMYEFDLSLESGTPGQAGEVRRLYAGQEFFVELTKVVPDQLLVFANLPSSFNGELSTGVAVITLTEVAGATTVQLIMSRRYSSESAEPNPQRKMRESSEFRARTRAMWQDRFLGRLKELSENG